VAPSRAIPPLCAITDVALAGGLSHAAIARELVAGGASWIQVRDKNAAGGRLLEALKETIAAVRAAPGGERILLVVNDRPDLAMASGADGTHLGEEDLPASEARRILGPHALLGVSTHSVEAGLAAASLPVDYVAIGPVFPTKTKRDAAPAVGLEAVRALASAIDRPVVGIGGIDARNAREVLDAGAAAVAVISALYDPPSSIRGNTAGLLAALSG